MATLAKLDLEPRSDRGPDVEHHLRVPAAWLRRGAAIEFDLPRRLSCAACKGGGCDICSRSGAFALHEKGQLQPPVVVYLTAAEPDARAVRLPETGATSEAGVRGHLILHIAPGDLSPGVRRIDAPAGLPLTRQLWLVFLVVLVIAAAGLVALSR
jgi:hypothetical protein